MLTGLAWAGEAAQAQELLHFDSTARLPAVRFVYPDAATDAYLRQLREQELHALPAAEELQRLLAVVAWTNGLWAHNGNNEPSQSDALTIIREARAGKKFRCVEYAKVSADALLALGMPARVVGLKTRDAATRKSGAGHVLTEVWLPQRGKWAMADAQFNLLPLLADVPLNAVELQQALARRQPVAFRRAAGPVPAAQAQRYIRFVRPYLYFFDVSFDQRQLPYAQQARVGAHTSLMLGPVGTERPAVFQRRFSLSYMLYTHALREFYRPPE
ncbi:hypothetical protein GCM10027048_38190 [Hymenobacter coalescens]